MASTETDQETPITREQLRTFHIAGHGLEHLIPAAPLRPAALDQIQQIPPFETVDLLSLYESSLRAARGEYQKAFLEKIRKARTSLLDLLALDSQGSTPESFGQEASVFFNAGALSAALGSQNGRASMEPARRDRIEATIAVLDNALSDARHQPPFRFFEGSGSFQAALEDCDKELDRFTTVLRALRIARLEVESAYQPVVHDEALARFDWQSADGNELLALPPVVVLETAQRLAQVSLTSFGRVLRSGRPIQVLITSAGLYAEDLSGLIPDFGYLGIAHREAFVLQSSLSRPEHLASGLASMAATLRPAVAIVSVPTAPGHDAHLAASLLYLSRTFPLFRYDPDQGTNWPEHFELLMEEELPVTAADFAAVSEDFLDHFRVLPAAAWDDEQMELSEYLRRYSQQPPLAIPFLWVNDESGNPQRAVLTRDLVNLCRDRVRAWNIFEDLAGVRNTKIKEEARREGVSEAIQRVVAMLTQSEQVVAKPAVVLQAAAAAVEEATVIAATTEDPYIDSFLCTSCNDCFKINSRVFQYDGNKQAYIADASAGTFAELVKAAEGCPARCIHPGTPRPGDSTATPQLLAKAAKLR